MSASPETSLSESSLGFPLKGTLRKNPFPKIVRQIARLRSTGSLYLLNGNTKKVVFFEQGQPISVRSNVLSECLGQILAREGLITQAQCDQTLESIRRTGKKQGELLIEMGLLSEGNLRYGLEAQLRHKLFDIFTWDDGRYQYKPDTIGDDVGLRFSAHAIGIIVGALLETTPEDRATLALEAHADRFAVIEDEPLELEIMPEERYLLDCLDGSRSISELLTESHDPPVPSIALLLYAAIQAGVVKLGKTRRPASPRPPRPDDGREIPDSQLQPAYTPNLSITTYEDTPLPGQLPKTPEHLPDTDDFGGVEDSGVQPMPTREVSTVLVAAERDTPDETFDDDLELIEPPMVERSPGGDEEPPSLVPDAAESGFYERLTFDDDDVPLSTTDVDEANQPEPELAAAAAEQAEPAAVTEEVEELEDLEPLEDLDELDESGLTTEAPLEAEATEGDVDEAAGLDALADIEVDEDLMLEDSLADLDDELAGLNDELDELDDLDDLDAELGGDAAEASASSSFVAGGSTDFGDQKPQVLGGVSHDLSDELIGIDELDGLELRGIDDKAAPADPTEEVQVLLPNAAAAAARAGQGVAPGGAMEFAQGEQAFAEKRWLQAIQHLEVAYERGVDVAELHAMLAWARFRASEEAPEMGQHALDLLDYAEEMNPNLAMIFAYRAAVLLAAGDRAGAQEAAQRALDIDPYDVLAIDVMDTLVS